VSRFLTFELLAPFDRASLSVDPLAFFWAQSRAAKSLDFQGGI
jgi:hypothetical protein